MTSYFPGKKTPPPEGTLRKFTFFCMFIRVLRFKDTEMKDSGLRIRDKVRQKEDVNDPA
jgi:hypothetical protein